MTNPHFDCPPFEDLPLRKNGPPGNAWGRFGDHDELGMLNLLTPDVVAAAAKEIKSGVRISLDWSLNKPSYPSFGRNPFKHTIKNKHPRSVNDDLLEFNTQCSSQWDGLRHYGKCLVVLYLTQERLIPVCRLSKGENILQWHDSRRHRD